MNTGAYSYMAQSTGVHQAPILKEDDWKLFLLDAHVPEQEAARHANEFVKNRIIDPNDLSKELLKELGVNVLGDIINIVKLVERCKETGASAPHTSESHSSSASPASTKHVKVNKPELRAEMTMAEFRKFNIDWGVYRELSGIRTEQVALHLYNACDSMVQNAIINSDIEFFKANESENLKMLENIVTKKSNPSVHRLAFRGIEQSDSEAVKDFIVRLRSAAKDCEFSCPRCQFDMEPLNVRDQFIKGVRDNTLQVDILAKADILKTLEDVQRHAEAFEAAVHDQTKLTDTSEVMAAERRYRDQTKSNDTSEVMAAERRFRRSSYPKRNQKSSCYGCGGSSHGGDRKSRCPAWGKKCLNCGNMNHFARVCLQKKDSEYQKVEEVDSAEALIAHVQFDEVSQTYTPVAGINSVTEITATVRGITRNSQDVGEPKQVRIFPDSGASLCLGGLHHAKALGFDHDSLIPSKKQVKAVGGSMLSCMGWIPARFQIEGHVTEQPLYICKAVDRLYFSRKGCVEVSILPECFPYPMRASNKSSDATVASVITDDMTCSIPQRPAKIPFPAVEENVHKLKKHLIKSFNQSVFKSSGLFKAMKTKPVHIHLKEGATPVAIHVPIPVPLNWQDEVKARLDRYLANGVIEPVPVGDPVTWCSQMFPTKREGDPKIRLVVDYQKLNDHCQRETHHVQSPFRLACQVKPHTKKTVFDATDGYHSIELDEESRKLTTFITTYGRFRYRRLPQGFLAAGDAYNRR